MIMMYYYLHDRHSQHKCVSLSVKWKKYLVLHIYNIMMYLVLHLSPITRAVQIDPVTRPTRRTDRIRPESGRLDCFGGSTAGLHYQKPILADRFRFSSPKT